MVSAVARAYDGGPRAKPLVGIRGGLKLKVFVSIECPKQGTVSSLSSVLRDKTVRY